MSCAPHDGWFGVPSVWKPEDDLFDSSYFQWRIVGRCRIYAAFFDGATECAEGLVVEAFTSDGMPAQRHGLYWSKPDRVFRLVPLREGP